MLSYRFLLSSSKILHFIHTDNTFVSFFSSKPIFCFFQFQKPAQFRHQPFLVPLFLTLKCLVALNLELLLITTDSRTLKFQGISYERAADESKPFFVKPIDIRRKCRIFAINSYGSNSQNFSIRHHYVNFNRY